MTASDICGHGYFPVKKKREVYMKKIILSLIIIITAFIFLNSCDDNPTDGGGGSLETIVFPDKVGDTWTYEILDSIHTTYDTVVVTIVGSDTAANGHSAKIWEYQYLSKTESTYVEKWGDTVNIYPNNSSEIPIERFIFPLHVGDGWMGDDFIFGDTTKVIDKVAISTKAGNFESFIIQRYWNYIDNAGIINTYFVPYHGTVKKDIRRIAIDGQHVELWDLIQYYVQLPGI
jgi:hypothetical protein